MPKIDINQAAEILKRNDLDPALLRQIVEEMNQAVEPELDEEKAPAVKKQFSILILDPHGNLARKELNSVGWVVQIPEDASVTSTVERIHKAVYEFNTTKKGRMMPAKTMGDAIENIPAKIFKEFGVYVKTKAPVFVIPTENPIPTETSEKQTRRR